MKRFKMATACLLALLALAALPMSNALVGGEVVAIVALDVADVAALEAVAAIDEDYEYNAHLTSTDDSMNGASLTRISDTSPPGTNDGSYNVLKMPRERLCSV